MPRLPKKPVKKYARKPAAKRTVKPTFDKRVKQVISRMAEDKVENYRGQILPVAYNNANWISTVVPMTPYTSFIPINQGTDQGSRVGNSIRVKKLKLSGVLRALPYHVTTNPEPAPMYVKLLFLTRKDAPMEIFASLGDIMQYGGTSEGPGADLVALTRPFNTDEWMVHTTRTYKIGYASYTGSSGDVVAQYHSNNDFKMNQIVTVDLTKYCTKVIKFDDNTANPSTRNIVMYPLVYYADNHVPAATEVQAAFDFCVDFEFEDT